MSNAWHEKNVGIASQNAAENICEKVKVEDFRKITHTYIPENMQATKENKIYSFENSHWRHDQHKIKLMRFFKGYR